MPDISELDLDAQRLKVSWRKAHNYFLSFAQQYFELKKNFEKTDYGLDKYGKPWNFNFWLATKAGLIDEQVLKRIELFGKQLADEEKAVIKAEQDRASQEKRDAREQAAAERRAAKEAKQQEAQRAKEERESKKRIAAAQKEAEKQIKANNKKKQTARKARAASTRPDTQTRRLAFIAANGIEAVREAVTNNTITPTTGEAIARFAREQQAGKLEEFMADPRRRGREKTPPKSQSNGDVLQALATRIIVARDKRDRATEDWIGATLELARALSDARNEFPSNNAFGDWLKDNKCNFNSADRAAYINMGHYLEVTREVLATTNSISPQLIWRHEIMPLLEERGIRFNTDIKTDSLDGAEMSATTH